MGGGGKRRIPFSFGIRGRCYFTVVMNLVGLNHLLRL